jgi:hypothetical protein
MRLARLLYSSVSLPALDQKSTIKRQNRGIKQEKSIPNRADIPRCHLVSYP